MSARHLSPRILFLFASCLLAAAVGCTSWGDLAIMPGSLDVPDDAEVEDEPNQPKMVGDMAVPFNTAPVQVEAIGLVVGLDGTGSDPPPSPQRAVLLDEMQTRQVENPNRVLQSPSTSLVIVRGFLRPGVQKGDRFDVELRVPSQSETTSLRGGRLLETRMTELRVLGGQVHQGHLLALAKGPVMIDPTAEPGQNSVRASRGRVLGGGRALKSRPLGLRLRSGYESVFNSSRVANAINRRFHTFDRGIKVGVAEAQTDKSIRLLIHPRYKDNIMRYIRVIRAIALRESTQERDARTIRLKEELNDPATTAQAALQLEAIGRNGADILVSALDSPRVEVRFHAAEALAFLDRREAADPLARVARDEPAFRVFALAALSVMDDLAATDALRELLSVPSAETRYGAFRALWTINPNDPLIRGENLGEEFSYHVLSTDGPPLVHVTRSRRPEVVVFGNDQVVLTPLAINAGNKIMVTGTPGGELSVARFSVGEADQKRVVPARLDDMIRAIVELDGTYPDVVQALQEAQASGALLGRFEVDALPEAGRKFKRRPNGPDASTVGGGEASEPGENDARATATGAKGSNDESSGGD